MIVFQCSCGRELFADSDNAGQMLACPACNTTMTIPSTADDIEPRTPPRTPPRSDDHVERPRPPRRRRRPDRYDDEYDEPRRGAPPRLQGTSGKAVFAFLLGILAVGGGAALFIFERQLYRTTYLSLLISGVLFIFGLVALILGIMSLSDIRRGRTGSFAAIVAIITGGMSLVGAPVIGLTLGVQSVRDSASRMQSQNNMKQIGIAMHAYHDVNRSIPQHAIYDQGKPMLSWRVAILPFIEQEMLYRQFRKNEPWNSPHNQQLLSQMPRTYAHPTKPDEAQKGLTYYQVYVTKENARGPGTLFRQDANWGALFGFVPDGASNTIMVVEAAEPVPWTKPADLVYDPNGPLPKIGGHFRNGLVNIGLADGWVRSIPQEDAAAEMLRPAITMDGGEPFEWP